jgi:hypothetical protein
VLRLPEKTQRKPEDGLYDFAEVGEGLIDQYDDHRNDHHRPAVSLSGPGSLAVCHASSPDSVSSLMWFGNGARSN